MCVCVCVCVFVCRCVCVCNLKHIHIHLTYNCKSNLQLVNMVISSIMHLFTRQSFYQKACL